MLGWLREGETDTVVSITSYYTIDVTISPSRPELVARSCKGTRFQLKEAKITHQSPSCVCAARVITVITQSQRHITSSYVLTGTLYLRIVVSTNQSQELRKTVGTSIRGHIYK